MMPQACAALLGGAQRFERAAELLALGHLGEPLFERAARSGLVAERDVASASARR